MTRRVNHDNWDDLRFLLALHRQGSIVAAARELDVTEVTVTRRLNRVERSLGTRLFERERGSIVSSEEVRSLMDRLVTIGDEISAVRNALVGADGEIVGLVRITGGSFIVNRILVPRLPELIGRHGGLEIEMIVDTMTLGITSQRETDIAVRLCRPTAEPCAITRKIGDISCGVYCHRDLVGSGDELDWIVYARRNESLPHARWIEEQRLVDGGEARVRVDDTETLLQCMRAGLGRSLLPEPFARFFPDLALLEGGQPPTSREMWILVHPSWREVRRIEVVMEWLVETLGDCLRRAGAGSERSSSAKPGTAKDTIAIP